MKCVWCFMLGHLRLHNIWISEKLKFDYLKNEKSFSSEIKIFFLCFSVSLFYVLVSCFYNLNFGFVIQISQLHSLRNKLVKFYRIHYLFSIIKFPFNFYLFMFKDFTHSNSLKLLILFINFLVAFLAKLYNCRFSLLAALITYILLQLIF